MSWTINYYPKETEKFLRKIGNRDETRIIHSLEVLEKYGFSQHNDDLKKIVGTENIWELKIKQFRIILIPLPNNIIQILNVFIKKSNKTPKETIDLIVSRARIFNDK